MTVSANLYTAIFHILYEPLAISADKYQVSNTLHLSISIYNNYYMHNLLTNLILSCILFPQYITQASALLPFQPLQLLLPRQLVEWLTFGTPTMTQIGARLVV